jgi:hypothetical protein
VNPEKYDFNLYKLDAEANGPFGTQVVISTAISNQVIQYNWISQAEAADGVMTGLDSVHAAKSE